MAKTKRSTNDSLPATRPQLDSLPTLFITGSFSFLVIGQCLPVASAPYWSSTLGLGALFRTLLTFTASVTFLLGPGLACRALFGCRRKLLSAALITLPGALLLIAWALGIWYMRIHLIADASPWIGGGLLALMAIAYFRRKHPIFSSDAERRVFVLYLLVAGIAIGKGLYSEGPVGELFGNEISRTTEVGVRSDSRIPFNIVELVANGRTLNSTESRSLHAPYLPTSRGPITGMMAAPVVILSGVSVPLGYEAPWRPFDRYGFASYRIFMACLGASSILVVFGLAFALSRSDSAALFSTSLLALCPFLVHESYFTWPKLYAGACIISALYAALCRWPAAAGLLLGFAFLAHPLALLSLPLLLIFDFAVRVNFTIPSLRDIFVGRGTAQAFRFPFSAVLMVVITAGIYWGWNSLSAGRSQTATFLGYVLLVNGHPASSVPEWFDDRGTSLLNTLVPFYLYLFHADDAQINSFSGPSPGIIRFYMSYWSTLPFGTGIVLFMPLVWCFLRIARRYFAPFVLFIVVPFVTFAVFWGASESGLMREGLHPWFLSLFVFLSWGLAKEYQVSRSFATFVDHLQYWRRLELLGMLLLPTLLTNNRLFSPDYEVTDITALAVMIAGTAILASVARRTDTSFLSAVTVEGNTSTKDYSLRDEPAEAVAAKSSIRSPRRTSGPKA